MHKFHLRSIILFIIVLTHSCYGRAQNRTAADLNLVGGPCEGCEAVYQYEATPSAVDTLPGFDIAGPKLRISGTVYKPDGKTPAPDVVLYLYHTNREGIYEPRQGEQGWRRQHGYMRGWVKTDTNGRYTFYTLKPGSYPSRSAPAHIHVTLMEPDGKYYWLGSYLFEDDPLLSDAERRRSSRTPRGGTSGILSLTEEEGLMVGTRDIILGRNVPGYE